MTKANLQKAHNHSFVCNTVLIPSLQTLSIVASVDSLALSLMIWLFIQTKLIKLPGSPPLSPLCSAQYVSALMLPRCVQPCSLVTESVRQRLDSPCTPSLRAHRQGRIEGLILSGSFSDRPTSKKSANIFMLFMIKSSVLRQSQSFKVNFSTKISIFRAEIQLFRAFYCWKIVF